MTSPARLSQRQVGDSNVLVTVIVQIATFIVFFYILYRLSWRVIARTLRKRSQGIETALRTSEENQRRAGEIQQETSRQLEQVRVETAGILDSANRAAEAQRQLLVEQARRDAEGLVRRARDAVGRERQAAVDELRQEAGRLAIVGATDVVRRSLDANANHELADRTIADVGRGR